MTRKQLLAPWRIDFIKSKKPLGCFICEKADCTSHELKVKNHVVAYGKHCFILLNDYPYNAGHLMISPLRHISDLEGLTFDERVELMEMTIRAKAILTDTMNPEGFNIGLNLGSAAGAGHKIHIHQHVVPRWDGDANFMTTVGEVRVLPEALEATTQHLIDAYRVRYEC